MDKKALIITIPKKTKWDTYERELIAAENGAIMNFKVGNFPKSVGIGGKCYIVYDRLIRGWMTISGFSEKNFICTTTGKSFSGKFVERTGKFHKLNNPIRYKGFQGFRYINEIIE